MTWFRRVWRRFRAVFARDRRYWTTCLECGAKVVTREEIFMCPVDYAEDGTVVWGPVASPLVELCPKCGWACMESECDWEAVR